MSETAIYNVNKRIILPLPCLPLNLSMFMLFVTVLPSGKEIKLRLLHLRYLGASVKDKLDINFIEVSR